MRLRRGVRAIALPVPLIMATGAGLASVPVSASAAARASRPGKVALKQTGAAASSVVSVRACGDNTFGQLGNGTTNANHNGTTSANHSAELPVAVGCLRTLALHTSAG